MYCVVVSAVYRTTGTIKMSAFDSIFGMLLLFIVYALAHVCIEQLRGCSDVRRWCLHAGLGSDGKRKRKRKPRSASKLTRLEALIDTILSVQKLNKKQYKALPTSQRELSTFQPQATDAYDLQHTCSKAMFEELVDLCISLNKLVDDTSASKEKLHELEHAISLIIEAHFPFAEHVARCSTNMSKVSCAGGDGKAHLHVRVKKPMPVNIMLLTRLEIEQNPWIRRLRVDASTRSGKKTKVDELVIDYRDFLKSSTHLETTTTLFVQMKWNPIRNDLEIKSQVGETDSSTRMPFTGNSPVNRASAGGLAYDDVDALFKCKRNGDIDDLFKVSARFLLLDRKNR